MPLCLKIIASFYGLISGYSQEKFFLNGPLPVPLTCTQEKLFTAMVLRHVNRRNSVLLGPFPCVLWRKMFCSTWCFACSLERFCCTLSLPSHLSGTRKKFYFAWFFPMCLGNFCFTWSFPCVQEKFCSTESVPCVQRSSALLGPEMCTGNSALSGPLHGRWKDSDVPSWSLPGCLPCSQE